MSEQISYEGVRRAEARAAYRRRLADYETGKVFPDPRTDELRDRGAALEWRRAVLRNVARRDEAKLREQIAANQEAALRRWHSNVTPLRRAK